MILLRRFALMFGIFLVPTLQVRYLLVIVPVGSLTPLISNSRYILDAWDMVISLFWVQAIVVAMIINLSAIFSVHPRIVVQIV
jgi:hypothetical protein